jgi:hypothetical protein
MHDPYELCRRLGVRVVPLDDLDRPAYYVREAQIALVDATLTREDAEVCAEWLLTAALRDLAAAG